ncbi:oxidoreductase [Alicyclobacillus cellulosilyticus]|uniref:Oxidoreductase n=1 Tax=Alicyclobacillus cellulosilyticus TaxID=1003997 RepID=A0A917K586_9BACL|nr:Gfo/Idh/MocA family oxidoreductase [Alicyclobacillus cellulosilyticus]GGJ00476.1 oxidoreductase [Alicyclobacillus cellulosilyticus]
MGSTFRFAVIGGGAISRTHVEQIRAIDGARVVAVVDVDEARARALGERAGAPWYTDYREVLRRDDVDIVTICTPSGTHGEIAIAAARAGKHVIVEKPLDVTLNKARQVVEVCRSEGVKLCVISQHRFDDATIRVREWLAQGKLGRPVLVEAAVNWYRPQSYYDRAPWAGTWAMDGGGVLMIQALHTIDVVQHLVGDVAEVSAYTATATHARIEVEDVAVVAVRFANGALGTIAATTSAYPQLPTRIEVFGTLGTAVIEDDLLQKLYCRDPASDEVPKEGVVNWAEQVGPGRKEWGLSHRRQFLDMLDAIANDREPVVNGEEGLKPMEVITAIYESARTGRPVTVAEVRAAAGITTGA